MHIMRLRTYRWSPNKFIRRSDYEILSIIIEFATLIALILTLTKNKLNAKKPPVSLVLVVLN